MIFALCLVFILIRFVSGVHLSCFKYVCCLTWCECVFCHYRRRTSYME